MVTITLCGIGVEGNVRAVRTIRMEPTDMAGYTIGDIARQMYHADEEAVEIHAMEPDGPAEGWQPVYPYIEPEGFDQCQEYLTEDDVHELVMPADVAQRWERGLDPDDVPRVAVVCPTYERGLAGGYMRPLSPWDEWAVGIGIHPVPAEDDNTSG